MLIVRRKIKQYLKDNKLNGSRVLMSLGIAGFLLLYYRKYMFSMISLCEPIINDILDGSIKITKYEDAVLIGDVSVVLLSILLIFCSIIASDFSEHSIKRVYVFLVGFLISLLLSIGSIIRCDIPLLCQIYVWIFFAYTINILIDIVYSLYKWLFADEKIEHTMLKMSFVWTIIAFVLGLLFGK